MVFHLYSLLLLIFLLPSTVHAGEVTDLHGARVSVADRSDAEYLRGVARALEVVIVKLTGDSNAARSKAGRGVVSQAKRLMQQFGYERRAGEPGQSDELMLRVEFDPRVLYQEMRSRGLVVWGKERPDTLCWLVVSDERGRRLVLAGDSDPVLDALQRQAKRRGIPVIFPLGDIAESNAIFAAQTRIELITALAGQSERYNPGAVLIGELQQILPGVWENNWTLTVGEETVSWEQQGDFAELLAEEATDTVADSLGRRYASPAMHANAQSVDVVVTGLRSARDYARTERYLRSLDSVSRLSVQYVESAGIAFRLIVQGGLPALAQSISFGRVLAATPGDPSRFNLYPQ